MNSDLNLDRIDADGAIRETAHEAAESLDSGDTRLGFLKKAGLAGGAAVGGGALLSALTPAAAMAKNKGKGRPPASFGKGDIGILNYALTLEYLEASFYNEAAANQRRTKFIKDRQTQVFLKAVQQDENAHVKALRGVLGSKAVKKPKFDFRGDTSNVGKFRRAAFVFENEGVHAYSGQAFNISQAKVLATALSIVTVEARHAAAIGLILKKSDMGITPDGAFDTPFTAGKVLKDVTSLNYIQG